MKREEALIIPHTRNLPLPRIHVFNLLDPAPITKIEIYDSWWDQGHLSDCSETVKHLSSIPANRAVKALSFPEAGMLKSAQHQPRNKSVQFMIQNVASKQYDIPTMLLLIYDVQSGKKEIVRVHHFYHWQTSC